MNDNELMHFGVQGMKWGIRNDETQARYARNKSIAGKAHASVARKAENRASNLRAQGRKADAKKASKFAYNQRQKAKAADIKKDRLNAAKKYNTFNMSTKELNERVNRLQTEKKLRELTESEVSPGRTAAKKTLKDIGTKVLIPVAAAAGTYVVAKGVSNGHPKDFVRNVGNIDPNDMGQWVGKKLLNIKKK